MLVEDTPHQRIARHAVTWGEDHVGGHRPMVVLSDTASCLAAGSATLSLVLDGVSRTVDVPGWVRVPEADARSIGLQKESFLTLKILPRPVESAWPPPNDGCHLTPGLAARLSANLASCLQSDEKRGFQRRLPPASLRAEGRPKLQTRYAVLRRSGWFMPEQGAVLSVGSARSDWAGQTWLVVSNTAFNRRSLYPEYLFVVLEAVSAHESAEYADAGRCVLSGLKGLVGTWLLLEETLQSIQMDQDWCGTPCDRCYSEKRKEYGRWMTTFGPDSGKCVRCDGANPCWPRRTAEVSGTALQTALLSVRRHVGVG